MIDFLWHLRGSVELDNSASDAEVLERLVAMLKKQRKTAIEGGSTSIVFEESLFDNFLGPNWRATVIYDRGRLWIEQEGRTRRLRYDFRSLQTFIFVSFAATVFLLAGVASFGFPQALKFPALAFGWVYGMNLILAVIRVPALIKRTVRGTGSAA